MQKDSHLVSSQIEGTYEARVSVMQKYLSMVKHITAGIYSFEVKLVPKTKNMAADAVSKLASSSPSNIKRSVMEEMMPQRSINNARQR